MEPEGGTKAPIMRCARLPDQLARRLAGGGCVSMPEPHHPARKRDAMRTFYENAKLPEPATAGAKP